MLTQEDVNRRAVALHVDDGTLALARELAGCIEGAFADRLREHGGELAQLSG